MRTLLRELLQARPSIFVLRVNVVVPVWKNVVVRIEVAVKPFGQMAVLVRKTRFQIVPGKIPRQQHEICYMDGEFMYENPKTFFCKQKFQNTVMVRSKTMHKDDLINILISNLYLCI